METYKTNKTALPAVALVGLNHDHNMGMKWWYSILWISISGSELLLTAQYS